MATKKKIVKRALPKKVAAKKAVAKKIAVKKSVAPRAVNAALRLEVEQFLFAQAEALDGKAWQAYIDTFTDDGVYWVPVDPAHTHWDGMPAIFIEDKDLMTVRMKRMQHPNAWSQQAEWGTSHVIGNVVIEKLAANDDVHVRSRFHMLELRRDDTRHFAGTYRHQLKRTKAGLRIKLQRVDMVNAQAPYEYVLQAWV